jgi:hypothetical protein
VSAPESSIDERFSKAIAAPIAFYAELPAKRVIHSIRLPGRALSRVAADFA